MSKPKTIITLLCTPEPQFLLPGVAAIAIGTAMGYCAGGTMNWIYASMALVSIVMLNAGANMLNDYFDHLSGNDWLNFNPTKFGGGSRYIQDGIVTPETMRTAGLAATICGISVGLVIVILTQSIFILMLGIAGVIGGFFWTAPPVKLCYRFPGEPHIFMMFGILPTFGAYYLQTGRLSLTPLIAAVTIGIHIAIVALINSIPDREADAAVDKKTFIVRFGLSSGLSLYRMCISTAYVLSLLTVFMANGSAKAAAAGHLFTLPAAMICLYWADEKRLSKPGVWLPNAFCIILYCLAGIAMTTAVLICCSHNDH